MHFPIGMTIPQTKRGLRVKYKKALSTNNLF